MATYIGFNTQNLYQTRTQQGVGTGDGTGNLAIGYFQPKKFKLVDTQLVIQDIINSLSIKQGDLPGVPGYGTTIWGYVFDPGVDGIFDSINNEIRRVISQDPRVVLNTVTSNFIQNGLIIELEISISPFNNAINLAFFLNQTNGQVTQV